MWFLYADESGDLGFDFEKKGTSKFFTICILATRDRDSFKRIGKAVKKTLSKKLNMPKKSHIYELKGSRAPIEAKRYFWNQIRECQFEIFSITLDKMSNTANRLVNKAHLYNLISRQVIERIPFHTTPENIQLVMDKCKSKKEIIVFNNYILAHLEGRINPKSQINIDHLSSHDNSFLQAVDLFSWGIFRKYEKQDSEWFDVFSSKILCDELC